MVGFFDYLNEMSTYIWLESFWTYLTCEFINLHGTCPVIAETRNSGNDLDNLESSIYTFVFWNIDWIFSYITTNAVIGLKFVLSNVLSLLHNSDFGYFFEYVWYKYIQNSNAQLFVNSVIFDLINFGKSIELPFTVSIDIQPVIGWYSPYVLEHPELYTCVSRYENNYYFSKFGEYAVSFYGSNCYLVLSASLQIAGNLFLVFYVWLLLKVFFFSYFFSTTNDSQAADVDHSVNSITAEAEKEISSIDDLIIIFLALFFIFGGYFMTHGLCQLLHVINSILLVFLIIPMFFFFIYVVPLCLLFDFGIFCFVYLRGSGPTSMLAAELLYDVINLFAFYIRVLIQLARILLMLIAGGSLQEFIYYVGVDYKLFFENENFFEDIYNIEFNLSSISYFFFVKFPGYILYWIYEIFHTYFVVTIQTIAFFAMVFWLFFYLFTFFFSEYHEQYFNKKRKLYKLFIEDLKK